MAWIADAQGKVYWFNRRWHDYIGAGAGEAGSGFRALHADHAERVARSFRAAVARGGAWEDTFPLRRWDGVYRWFLSRAEPVRDPTGAVVHWFGTNTDVTEARETQAALRDAAERVELALGAGAIIGTWFWDLVADRFTIDEPFALAFGIDPSRVHNGLNLEQVIETVHPDDKAGLREAIAAAIARGGPYAHQYRVRRSDGNYYWIEANGRVDHGADGTPLAFPGVLVDLQERRALQEERDRAQRLLETFTRALPGVVYAKDLRGAMLVANRGAAELIGKPPEFFIGKTDAEFLDSAEEAAAVMATDRRIMETGVGEQIEEEVSRPGGERTIWLSTKEPLRDEAGQVIGLIGSSVDVTAWKRTEEARELLAREVDHRARNVLTIIQSVVRLTDASGPDDLRAVISGRVDAIARAQGSLAKSNWEGARFEDVIRQELAACARVEHVHLEGPDLYLSAEQVQPLSMIVYELSTNAMKYGALSAPEGAVSIRWTGSGRDWKLTWTEAGGPVVAQPTRAGFGSRLIANLARQLGGAATFTWEPTGLVAEIEVRP
ncbi:MAG: PAS domain-containing protein [Phenylobacterium sp.]|nr:PAS domain-containing protein [Phenylobacterium sp.]